MECVDAGRPSPVSDFRRPLERTRHHAKDSLRRCYGATRQFGQGPTGPLGQGAGVDHPKT